MRERVSAKQRVQQLPDIVVRIPALARHRVARFPVMGHAEQQDAVPVAIVRVEKIGEIHAMKFQSPRSGSGHGGPNTSPGRQRHRCRFRPRSSQGPGASLTRGRCCSQHQESASRSASHAGRRDQRRYRSARSGLGARPRATHRLDLFAQHAR